MKPLGVAVYLACGLLTLVNVGRKRSSLQWDEPPNLFRRAVVVCAWPAVLVHVLMIPKRARDEDDPIEGA